MEFHGDHVKLTLDGETHIIPLGAFHLEAMEQYLDVDLVPLAMRGEAEEIPGGNGRKGVKVTRVYARAQYGDDGHWLTVPVDGDTHAQALNYAIRSEPERAQMKKRLQAAGAWRIGDNGEVLTEEEQHDSRLWRLGLHPDQHAEHLATAATQAQEQEKAALAESQPRRRRRTRES